MMFSRARARGRMLRAAGVVGCSLVITLLAGVAMVPGVAPTPTLAAWTDAEWVHGDAAVRVPRTCVTPGLYGTQGAGRFLGGSLLGLNLDSLALVQGVTAQNSGTASSSVPSTTPIATDTFANPLNTTLISAINVAIGQGLQLGLPAGQVGAYNQWGQAKSTGQSSGAAGLVNNSGAVGVTGTPADKALPTSASLNLNTLLPGIAALANVKVNVGAIASSAVLDWCRTLENRVANPAAPVVVTRNYGIARLDVATISPLVAAVGTGTAAAVNTATGLVNAIAGPTGLVSSTLTLLVKNLVAPLLGLLSLGTATATASVTIDLAPVSALLTQTLSDGVITVNLASGELTVDLAALLGGVNGLNNLAPNTQLVLNAAVISTLIARLTTMLDSWTTLVVNTLQAVFNNAVIATEVKIQLTAVILGFTVHVADLTVAVNGTIASIAAGTATVTAGIAVLPAAGPILGLVNALVSGILTAVTGAAGKANLLGGLTAAITPVLTGALTTLGSSIRLLTAPVVTLLGTILTPLTSVLSVMVNVQPDQPAPPPSPAAVAGRYQVSALRIGVLDGVGTAAAVLLATSSAGPDVELSG